MEPTYYWDALSPEARRWLAEHTEPGETIRFATFPHSWLYLRQTGALPNLLAGIDRGQPKWYVLQNRPGAFSPLDRSLVAECRPAYTVIKLGVPLIWIFPFNDVERRSGRTQSLSRTIRPGATRTGDTARPDCSANSCPTSITHAASVPSCKFDDQKGEAQC